jgi:selenide, water dikinase
VPAIEEVLALLESGEGVSGGNRRNAEFAAPFTTFADGVDGARRALFCDPMTSGGLLVATPEALAAEMEEALAAAAPGTRAIGSLEEGEAGQIRVNI